MSNKAVIMNHSVNRISNVFKSCVLSVALVVSLVLTISLSNAGGRLMDEMPSTEASNFTLMSAHGSDISLSDYENLVKLSDATLRNLTRELIQRN